MNKIRIVIDRDKCQSAANCAAIAPDVYDLDDEYKAIVKGRKHQGENRRTYTLDANDSLLKKTIDGAKSCPFQAIEIYDEQTGEKIYPSQ